jgi:transposase InsO family protein
MGHGLHLLPDLGRVAYVAFIVDVFAQKIVAWNRATSKGVELVMTPLRIATWQRQREGRPVVPGELIGHADAGSLRGQFSAAVDKPATATLARTAPERPAVRSPCSTSAPRPAPCSHLRAHLT